MSETEGMARGAELVVLGGKLRAERLARGITLRELAGVARLSVSYISMLERGQTDASTQTLSKLCFNLGITIGDLFAPTTEEARALHRAARPRIDLTSTA